MASSFFVLSHAEGQRARRSLVIIVIGVIIVVGALP